MSLWVPKLRAEQIIEGALYQEALGLMPAVPGPRLRTGMTSILRRP